MCVRAGGHIREGLSTIWLHTPTGCGHGVMLCNEYILWNTVMGYNNAQSSQKRMRVIVVAAISELQTHTEISVEQLPQTEAF